MKPELTKRLEALSEQEGHPGTIDIRSVVDMIELRDELIKRLEGVYETRTLRCKDG